MGRGTNRSLLARHIAQILNAGTGTASFAAPQGPAAWNLLGGVALLTLAAAPVGAAGLGEVQLHSALGEPLRAGISVTVAPGETMTSGCATALAPQSHQLKQLRRNVARVRTIINEKTKNGDAQ